MMKKFGDANILSLDPILQWVTPIAPRKLGLGQVALAVESHEANALLGSVTTSWQGRVVFHASVLHQ